MFVCVCTTKSKQLGDPDFHMNFRIIHDQLCPVVDGVKLFHIVQKQKCRCVLLAQIFLQ